MALEAAASPASLLSGLTEAQLLVLAKEVRGWQRSGFNPGGELQALSHRLVIEFGMLEDGAIQVTESLVVQEICDRWIERSASIGEPGISG